MKKFLSFLLLVAVAVVGATYYMSIKMEEEYKEEIKGFDGNETKIVSSEFKRGIFYSNAQTVVLISKEVFSATAFAEDFKEDLVVKVSTNFSHSPLDLINGAKSTAVVEMQNEPYKSIAKKFFGTEKFLNIDVLLKGDIYTTQFELAPFIFEDQGNKFTMTPLKANVVHDKKNNIHTIKLFQDSGKLDAASDGFGMSYGGLSYLVEFTNPINAVEFQDFAAFLNAKINFTLANLTLKDQQAGDFIAENITSTSDIKTIDDNISSLDKVKIAKLAIRTFENNLDIQKPAVNKGELFLNEISLDTSLVNLSKSAYLNLVSSINDNSDVGILSMLDAFVEIMEKGPMLNVKNFSMNNDDNKTLSFNFILGVDINTTTPPNLYDDIMNKIIFNGEFKSDVDLKAFFAKLNDKDIEEISDMMISKKIMQKTDSGYISKFKYIPEKGIIVNDTINLFDIEDKKSSAIDRTDEIDSNSTIQ